MYMYNYNSNLTPVTTDTAFIKMKLNTQLDFNRPMLLWKRYTGTVLILGENIPGCQTWGFAWEIYCLQSPHVEQLTHSGLKSQSLKGTYGELILNVIIRNNLNFRLCHGLGSLYCS